jgi:hypothetical protein
MTTGTNQQSLRATAKAHVWLACSMVLGIEHQRATR